MWIYALFLMVIFEERVENQPEESAPSFPSTLLPNLDTSCRFTVDTVMKGTSSSHSSGGLF